MPQSFEEHFLFEEHFPRFARFLASGMADPVDEILPPATVAEVEAEERQLGIPLPSSYKTFLLIARGVFIQGGGFQMGLEHSFFHEAPPLEKLTPFQRLARSQRPPPSEGMLCFADYWLDGDGDQALFDVKHGLVDGEYPVFYYNHDDPRTMTTPASANWPIVSPNSSNRW